MMILQYHGSTMVMILQQTLDLGQLSHTTGWIKMTLFGPNSILNINRRNGPIGFGVIHPIPSSYNSLYYLRYCEHDMGRTKPKWSNWFRFQISISLFKQQPSEVLIILWSHQHLLWTFRHWSCCHWSCLKLCSLPNNSRSRETEEEEERRQGR